MVLQKDWKILSTGRYISMDYKEVYEQWLSNPYFDEATKIALTFRYSLLFSCLKCPLIEKTAAGTTEFSNSGCTVLSYKYGWTISPG